MSLPSQYFRVGAGAVIANAAGHVLALERSDVPDAWQFPQGGLEAHEDALTGIWREIREETGLTGARLELVARYPQPLAYELPPRYRSAKTGLGQVQYWFLFRFRGEESDIRLPSTGEFRNWRWMVFEQVADGAVEFRKPVYVRILEHFSSYLKGSAQRVDV